MASIKDKILRTTEGLYPTGRAFSFKAFRKRLHAAIAETEVKFFSDSVAVQDAFVPDTERFSADDCTEWERILGLGGNGGNSLSDRKAAIRRKMAQPGSNPAKLHYLHIQANLQQAGFNVWVHENLFPIYGGGHYSLDPIYVLPQMNFAQLGDSQLNDFQLGSAQTYYAQYLIDAQLGNFQLGDMQLNGTTWYHKVANSIYAHEDATFNHGEGFRSTFFIGGQTLGTFANVTAGREQEFRQLITVLKPTHKVALLLINYT